MPSSYPKLSPSLPQSLIVFLFLASLWFQIISFQIQTSLRSYASHYQAEMCAAVLADAKRYHRRHKICEFHAKAPVVFAGLRQRFCQQCSRFHEVSEFKEAKRSCRRRLAGHNERREKGSTSGGKQGSPPGGEQVKESQCRAATDERGNSAAYNHFQIR